MARKKRTLDKEVRMELTKENCHAIMDYLMVQFTDKQDYHYNYYFDTPERSLEKNDVTLRLRTIRKEGHISYHLTLRVPTIEEETYLEYYQRLSEKQMRLLVYNNKLPDGDIKDLNSVHGGNVQNVNVIRVNRVWAPYKDIDVYFDKISHRGKTHYEVGTKIDSSQTVSGDEKLNEFKELLSTFGIDFKQAKRRSKKFR